MKNFPSITKLGKLSSGVLQEQAAHYLAEGSYKLTLEIYKILLKREDNPRYRQGLAECYLKRALSEAEKGQFKQAVTSWENYSQHSDKHEANEQFVLWLAEIGQVAKLKAYLETLDASGFETEYPLLAETLAYLHSAEKIDLNQYLAADSVLCQHADYARQALKALQHNNTALMQENLSKIPFSSAFRELVIILKAANLVFSDPVRAKALLARIKVHSLYSEVADLIMMLPLTGQPLINALLTLAPRQQQILCHAKNWSDNQCKLLQFFNRHKDNLTAKNKFDMVIKFQALFGEQYSQRYCLALLSSYPAGQRVYEKNFGKLDTLERLRISALKAETKNDAFLAVEYWDQCLEILYEQEIQDKLKIALILRHMAELSVPDEQITYYQESLNFDLQDKATHLKILDYYLSINDKNNHKKCLQDMLELFPDDIEVLALVMHAAIKNQTFKKATQYADKILNIDPVNTQAKQVLFNSHLNHARKLINNQKFHLVEKEIALAEQLNLSKQYRENAQILLGFFVYLSEDKQKGLQILERIRQQSTQGDFVLRFRLINEALVLNVSITGFLKSLAPLAGNYELTATELKDFLQYFDEQHKQSNPVLVKALDKVKKDFKRLIKNAAYDQQQLQAVMQRLQLIKHFELMRHVLSCATEHKQEPIWVFYKIYIAVKGKVAEVSFVQISTLQLQYTRAKEQQDTRSMVLISSFLDKILVHKNEQFDFRQEEEEDDFYDAFAMLFDDIDSRTMGKINRKFDQIQQKLSEEKLVELFMEMIPDKKSIPLFFQNPDAFDALLFLKAAQELDIDINVSVNDILDIVRQEQRISSHFPFPF